MVTEARTLRMAMMVIGLAGLASCAGGGDGPCPVGWYAADPDDAEPDGSGAEEPSPRCIPTLTEEQAIRERVGTGLYGYTTLPVGNSRTYECDHHVLYEEPAFVRSAKGMSHNPKPEDITVFPDGHWEIRLEAGRPYKVSSTLFVATRAAAPAPNVELSADDDEDDMRVVELEQGQTLFAHDRGECAIAE